VELSDQYIAGLFDGEGHVCIENTDKHVRMGIANTHLPVLEAVSRRFGGKIYTRKCRSDRHHPVHHWEVYKCDEQRAFLEAIRPFVVIKADAVGYGLAFLSTHLEPGVWRPLTPAEWAARAVAREGLYRVNADHGNRRLVAEEVMAYACI
jgi:hypothetical protein